MSGMHNVVEEFEDGRTLNRIAINEITQKWVNDLMNKRESEFTTVASGLIFCGTWNVNAKKQDEGLQDWLLAKTQNQSLADLYVIGFQEIVDLNATNVILDTSKTQQRSLFWQERIEDSLNGNNHKQNTGNGKYRLLNSKSLVGLLLCVYAKQSVMPFITDVRSTHEATGLLGMMGNKGGVCIRLNMYDTSICFVCSHLAAHRENVAGRNADYKTIVDNAVFPVKESTVSGAGTGAGDGNLYNAKKTQSAITSSDIADSNAKLVPMPLRGAVLFQTQEFRILEHELVFWVGDLNYRIDDSITTDEVFEHIEKGNLGYLRNIDQLNIERAKGNAFKDFTEGELLFEPTYKYQPGTDHYDRRPDKKVRAPAWCDRILVRSTLLPAETYTISQAFYQRSNLIPSDHKPVASLYTVKYRKIIIENEQKVYREIMQSLEQYQGRGLAAIVPNIDVDMEAGGLNMGLVKYEMPSTRTIRITNTGQSIAYWRFVPKLEDDYYRHKSTPIYAVDPLTQKTIAYHGGVGKSWVYVNVHSGLLLPGQSYTVSITVKVDTRTACALNSGQEVLQDVLVLRLENGLDRHIPIFAEYCCSCFGMSLEMLVHTLTPVRANPLPGYLSLQSNNKAAWSASGSDGETQEAREMYLIAGAKERGTTQTPLQIPKELWRLVDALWSSNALREKDLFAVGDAGAKEEEVAMIREALDCGLEFTTSTSPHCYAKTIQDFLVALPCPLLPFDTYPHNDIESTQLRSWCKRYLDQMKPLHYNVFVYIISFFREVVNNRAYNRCTMERMTEICLQTMTSSNSSSFYEYLPPDEIQKRITRRLRMRNILQFFLTTTAL